MSTAGTPCHHPSTFPLAVRCLLVWSPELFSPPADFRSDEAVSAGGGGSLVHDSSMSDRAGCPRTVSARHDGDRLLRGCGTIARLELGEPEVYSSPAPVELGGKVDLVTMLTMFNDVEAANGYGAAEARRGAVPSRTPAVPNGAHTSSVEWLSLLVRGWSLPRGGAGAGAGADTGSARKNWC